MLDYRKTHGLVLGVGDWREAGAMVTIFTRQLGKIIALAPGLKKINSKLAASILPGNVVYLTLAKRTQWHITGAKIAQSLAWPLLSVINFRLSSMARECLLNLIPPDAPDKKIFSQAVQMLEILGGHKYNIATKEIIVYRFLFALFKGQGILPSWNVCQRCGKKFFRQTVSYWQASEGIICLGCVTSNIKKESRAVPLSLLKLFQQKKIFVNKNGLTDGERQLWKKIIGDIYARETNKEFKSLARG